jgi:hypothetical protein
MTDKNDKSVVAYERKRTKTPVAFKNDNQRQSVI